MIDDIYISGIKHDSIVDGINLRNVIFISGCWHNCNLCQSPTTHNPINGIHMKISDVIDDVMSDNNDITLSGGDPLTYQLLNTKELVYRLKEIKPNINIWLYTGFLFEDIIKEDNKDRVGLVKMCDVVVDGRFINELKSMDLRFKGSRNQRIIDVKKSLKEGKVILFE